MRDALRCLIATLLLLLGAVIGCAGPGRLVEVPAGQDEIALTARSFHFDPEHVVVRAGGLVTLRVRNDSESNHNLTVTDPEGVSLRSVALAPGETVSVEISLARPGVYRFYCAEPFHPTLGMEGRIEAR